MSFFITFEGGEGAGKSTQIAKLEERLLAAGHPVVRVREPGGTPFGEAIYALLRDPSSRALRHIYRNWVGAEGEPPLDPLAELFLFEAARTQLVARKIAPALESGQIVLSDRFADSTTAYQGYGRGLSLDLVTAVNTMATGGLVPDLTILLDTPAEVGLERSHGTKHRMEQQGIEFHDRVRRGYLAIASADSDRFRVIDGCEPVATVAETVWRTVAPLLRGTAR